MKRKQGTFVFMIYDCVIFQLSYLFRCFHSFILHSKKTHFNVEVEKLSSLSLTQRGKNYYKEIEYLMKCNIDEKKHDFITRIIAVYPIIDR